MRIPQYNKDNAPGIPTRDGLLMRMVSHEKGISSLWVCVITDGHMFHVSLDNSKAASAAREHAMKVSTDPSEVGADVQVKLSSVYYGGDKIGELKAYDGSDVSWADTDNIGDLILVRKLSRSGNLVLTKGKKEETDAGTKRHYLPLGICLVKNLVRETVPSNITSHNPRAVMTVYLKFLDTLYQDGIEVDYDDMSFVPRGDQRVQKIEMEIMDRFERVVGLNASESADGPIQHDITDEEVDDIFG